MKTLKQLFDNNRQWASQRRSSDPDFFDRLSKQQAPTYLWIGCADSRVPANEIVGLDPGELFVHRNVANVVHPEDPNCLSVIQFSVDVLKVRDIIVCGHYGCGGVQAAMGPAIEPPLETWISPIRGLYGRVEGLDELPEAERWRKLCELNVEDQIRTLRSLPTIKEAWARGQELVLHGWIYDLSDGLLHDLELEPSDG